MDGVRIRRLLPALLALATLPAHAAEPRLTDERLRAMLAPSHALATSGSAAIFETHFAESCIAVAGLPFDLTCNHVPVEERDDPSPWPDVFVGLRGDRIVAALVMDTRRVPRSWACSRLPDLGGHLCAPRDIPAAVRRDWAERWSTVLRSAG